MKRRVLLLIHKNLIPPKNATNKEARKDECLWSTEYDVTNALKALKHEILVLGADSDLTPIGKTIEEFNPHIVFNLLEMFDGEVTYDQNVVSYLELLRVPYTGCNPRGLMLARDKGLSKKILNFHRIPCPKFWVFQKNKKAKKPKHLEYPLIVKCLREEASYGISQASVVHNDDKLFQRVEFINKNLGDHAIAEQFISGRELFVGMMGNDRLETFPVWELNFDKVDHPENAFYTSRAKFNTKYRKEKGIQTRKANLTPELNKKIIEVCKKTFKILNLNGQARMDLRLSMNNEIYFIEANPNPDISMDDDFAQSAANKKISYNDLIQKIINLGLSWSPS